MDCPALEQGDATTIADHLEERGRKRDATRFLRLDSERFHDIYAAIRLWSLLDELGDPEAESWAARSAALGIGPRHFR